MLANGTTAIIFPLRAKLSLLFSQTRPKCNGGRRVVRLPVLPWVDSDSPPNVSYGLVNKPPTLNENCWIGFGLCAVNNTRNIRLQDVKQPVLRPSFGGKFTPDVVHALKPLPASFYKINGTSRDSSGAILGNCIVELFVTNTDVRLERTLSNADGLFYFKSPALGVNHYIVAYKTGAPDVSGTTLNTLQATM
jgi:hypothetical protein